MLYVARGGPALYTKPLVAHFKDRLVADIHPGDIRTAAEAIYPKASPATRNRQGIAPARAAINAAAEAGLCGHIRVKGFKTLKPIRRTVDASWMTNFRSVAGPELGALALFMMTTAARVGQAVRLEWRDIDLQRFVARIPPAKGHEAREAILTPEMVAALANLSHEKGGRVFGYGSRFRVYAPWRAACEAAKIVYVPPHQAGRHTFATIMLAAGVDLKIIAESGGWKSLRLMLETYAHAGDKAAAVRRAFGTFASQADDAKPAKTKDRQRKTRR